MSEISHAQHKWYRTCKKRFQDDKDECEEKGGGGAVGIYTEKSNNINSDQLDPKLV